MMRHPLAACLTIAALAVAAWPDRAAARDVKTSAGAVTVAKIADGFDVPWAVAFLPDSTTVLVTDRDGILWGVDTGTGAKASIKGLPEISASGQGGLLDVAIDPGFATNRTLFLSFSQPLAGRKTATAVARATLSADGRTLDGTRVIWSQDPALRGGRHFGSRIVFAPDGTLFVTTGDRGDRPMAQENNEIGKVIRITKDGRPAPANPNWAGRMPPEVYSVGHRNMQGAALDETGQLWTISHGAQGGDEVNRPEPGKNYGWPVISYGEHYGGGKIGVGTARAGLEQPKWYWEPSIAPAGLAILQGDLFPGWQGDLLVGSLKFDHIQRLDRDGATIGKAEILFDGIYGRIRDVREGPDGAIWFLSEGDGALYRAAPSR